MIFEGSATALVTPFTSNGVNKAELKKLIKFNLRTVLVQSLCLALPASRQL